MSIIQQLQTENQQLKQKNAEMEEDILKAVIGIKDIIGFLGIGESKSIGAALGSLAMKFASRQLTSEKVESKISALNPLMEKYEYLIPAEDGI